MALIVIATKVANALATPITLNAGKLESGLRSKRAKNNFLTLRFLDMIPRALKVIESKTNESRARKRGVKPAKKGRVEM